jgi:O-antigen/teichoic acid export membrane protein
MRVFVMSKVKMAELRVHRLGLLGGLTDQAIVSAGNFGLNILLARSFSEVDYGAFGLIFSFVLFLNTLHQAFVIFPLSVEGAAVAPSRLGYFLALAASLTLLETILFFPVIGGAALSVGRLALFLPASAFMLTWQLQEVWRRALIARGRYATAIGNDFVRYIGTLAALLALSWLRLLSLPSIFLLLIAASLVTSWPLLAPLLAEGRGVRRKLKSELRAHWRMAAPVMGANLLAVLSTQWFLWLLAWGHDLASSATLVALANIVGFAGPVMYGLENILVPEIARQRDSLTFTALKRLMGRCGLAGGLLVTPFFAVVLIWPSLVLHLFYGAHKSYAQFSLALQMLAAAYVTYLIAYILSATLRGYRASHSVLKMQLYPALMGITLGSWLTLRFGVSGACLAALIAGAMRVAIGWYHVGRLRELTLPEGHAPARHRMPRAAQGV